MASNNMTKAWEFYEAGRQYNNSLKPNQYKLVDTNIEFFIGNQWLHLPETPAAARLPKPTFNIIKRITSMFIASITSSAVNISFDPLTYYDGENLADPETNAATYATAEVQNLFDKFKMEYRIRDALFDGAQTGDYAAHFYWDPDAMPYGGAFGAYRGEIKMELVDGINVMFGNPNDSDIQSQPYVILVGRDTVENLRWEAERFKKLGFKQAKVDSDEAAERASRTAADSPELIVADRDYMWQAGQGGHKEVIAGSDDCNGKALYVYLYTKRTHEEPLLDAQGNQIQEPVLDKEGNPVYEKDENGLNILDMNGQPVAKTKPATQMVTSVFVTKATKSAVIYEDIDTGLSCYPIAWGNWERQKNQYHGRALVTGIVPNQIFINTMFALVMRHLQLQSLPKTIYNADLIAQWDNEVGKAIAVHGLQPGQNIEQVAFSMKPADMSGQIIQCIDRAIDLTRECLGATDAQMGKVNPENTSALMVLQSASEVPLENVRANLYEWIEDIGRILLDMMGTYYKKRPLVRDRQFREIVRDADTQAPQIDPMTGHLVTKVVSRRVAEEFDFSQFKHLYLNVRVDVGASTYFSEIAMVQTLDNLRRDGTLDIIDYLERLPDKLISRKADLIDSIKERMAQQQAQAQAELLAAQQSTAQQPAKGGPGIPGSTSQLRQIQGTNNPNVAAGQAKASGKPTAANPTMGGPLDKNKMLAKMTPNDQAEYENLPKSAQNALAKVQAMKM